MSLQTALVAMKTANSTLNTLVGTRFHPDALPQAVTLPAIRFQEISKVPAYTYGLASPLWRIGVQMDGYVQSARSGGTAGARATLETAIRGCFTQSSSLTIGGETLQGVYVDSEAEDIEMLDANSEADHVRTTLVVWMQ